MNEKEYWVILKPDQTALTIFIANRFFNAEDAQKAFCQEVADPYLYYNPDTKIGKWNEYFEMGYRCEKVRLVKVDSPPRTETKTMKPKTEISKLTVDMNLGRVSIGNYLLRLRTLAIKHGSEFSNEFLDAVEKEGIRLKEKRVVTEHQRKELENQFSEVFGDNPPLKGDKNDEL